MVGRSGLSAMLLSCLTLFAALFFLFSCKQCRLHDSIAVMESLVREDPTAFLTERIALNLCTLYELSADTSVATRKKQLLQLIAKRFFLHDIGPESFRIGGG